MAGSAHHLVLSPKTNSTLGENDSNKTLLMSATLASRPVYFMDSEDDCKQQLLESGQGALYSLRKPSTVNSHMSFGVGLSPGDQHLPKNPQCVESYPNKLSDMDNPDTLALAQETCNPSNTMVVIQWQKACEIFIPAQLS